MYRLVCIIRNENAWINPYVPCWFQPQAMHYERLCIIRSCIMRISTVLPPALLHLTCWLLYPQWWHLSHVRTTRLCHPHVHSPCCDLKLMRNRLQWLRVLCQSRIKCNCMIKMQLLIIVLMASLDSVSLNHRMWTQMHMQHQCLFSPHGLANALQISLQTPCASAQYCFWRLHVLLTYSVCLWLRGDLFITLNPWEVIKVADTGSYQRMMG